MAFPHRITGSFCRTPREAVGLGGMRAMSERMGRTLSFPTWLLICALAILALVAGCGRTKSQDAGATEEGGAGGGRRRSFATAGREGGRGARSLERRGGFSDRAAGPIASDSTAAARRAPGAASAPTFVQTEAVQLSEVEKTEKIRAFAAAYGPIQLVQEKNWDDRILNWVTFTHEGKKFKMPLVMIYDAPNPEILEGYFGVYPASGSPGKAVATQTITASSTISVPAEPEPAFQAAEAEAEAAVPAAAGPEGRRGRGARGGRRGGMGG
jgi:hypothetical protein